MGGGAAQRIPPRPQSRWNDWLATMAAGKFDLQEGDHVFEFNDANSRTGWKPYDKDAQVMLRDFFGDGRGLCFSGSSFGLPRLELPDEARSFSTGIAITSKVRPWTRSASSLPTTRSPGTVSGGSASRLSSGRRPPAGAWRFRRRGVGFDVCSLGCRLQAFPRDVGLQIYPRGVGRALPGA